MNRTLWIVQGLLAFIFLLAGGSKLVSSAEVLAAQYPSPPIILRLVGVAEMLGALGLVLPGLLHIRLGLTSLAALGLVSVMIGAVVTWCVNGSPVMALPPLILGCLAAFVAAGRWEGSRYRPSPRRLVSSQ